jgi:hypothetical protein
MWKDHATGDYGDIFKLIQLIEQLDTRREVFGRINDDFGLGFTISDPIRRDKIIWYEKPTLNEIKIKVVNQELSRSGKAFWDQFKIDKQLLEFYNTTQISYYWTYLGQPAPNTAADPHFAYRVGNFYQLYAPYLPKVDKFRNDWPENYFFGYIQLPKQGDRIIIDKSSKDVIFCRRLGEWAVSSKSETTYLPTTKVLELKERFNKVYLMLDNDAPGQKMVDKYMNLYPFLIPKFMPKELGKDKTDVCKKIGFEETEKLIKQLLDG